MKKILRISGFIFLALVILIAGGFVIWASNPAEPQAVALQGLAETREVNYSTLNGWLVFEPADGAPTTGLILYPGGRVDPRAYAPTARSMAATGVRVVLVPMPLNFAFLGLQRASQVIEAYPEIAHWAVGGHSLGGAMAAEFAQRNADMVDGLVLWASYPAENTDLSALDMRAISIYAENDGLAQPQEVLASKPRLPEGTTFVEISGGNHAGFGWYGPQRGDGEAAISIEEQQSEIVAATAEFLAGLSRE